MPIIKLLLIILFCTLPLHAQQLIAETHNTKFFVYKESVFAIGERKILFSTKAEIGKVIEINTFLVNCGANTFVKLSHHRQIGTTVTNPPFSQAIQRPKKDSAIQHAIHYVCQLCQIKP